MEEDLREERIGILNELMQLKAYQEELVKKLKVQMMLCRHAPTVVNPVATYYLFAESIKAIEGQEVLLEKSVHILLDMTEE